MIQGQNIVSIDKVQTHNDHANSTDVNRSALTMPKPLLVLLDDPGLHTLFFSIDKVQTH
jgi:hypothetical protein